MMKNRVVLTKNYTAATQPRHNSPIERLSKGNPGRPDSLYQLTKPVEKK